MNRLFFAIAPSDEERAAAEKAARQVAIKQQPTGRAVPAGNYHVTLIFLGDVSELHEQAAIRAARTIQLDPLALRFDQAASFKNKDIPWWLGPRAGSSAGLTELRDDLHRVLHGAGVPLPKRTPLVPHITIQRHEKTQLAPTPVAPFDWKASEFVLMRSHLQAKPYEVVERFPLVGRPAPMATPSQPDQLSLL